jgi:hypothetical protein
MSAWLRSTLIILALSASVALLPHLGLPYRPLKLAAAQLNGYVTPTPTPTATRTPTPTPTYMLYLPLVMRSNP